MLAMFLLASPAEEAALVRLTGGKSTEQQIEITSWTTGVLVFLVVLWALFGPKLGRYHLTEGSAACLLGLLCGLLLLAMRHYIDQQAVVSRLLAFSAASFFTYLLPPVIFYAGLSIEKTLFFSNLGSILALGVVGTAFAALLLAAFLAAGFAGLKLLRLQDCLALGAIFSATDSVATLQVLNPERQPVLFSLVFGEGVINDATSVVLLGAVSTIFPNGAAGTEVDPASQSSGWEQMGGIALTFLYLFFTSLALGAATGMGISCLVVRFASHGPHHEVALIGLLSYLSYLAAEVLGLSGILSLFCCGLTVSHFALDGISTLGRTTTLNAFHTMSYICEGIIFIYLGMDALDPAKWQAAHPGEAISLCGALLFLLVVARGASVLPVTALHNWLHPVKLSSTDIVIIWWSGLMRGAVSVALAYYYFDIGSPSGSTGDSHRSTLIAATLVVVLTSVMLLGAATQPLMQFLVEDPEMGFLDKIGRCLRNSQLNAKGCAANLISGICCCLSGRGPRATYPNSSNAAGAALTKKHSAPAPAPPPTRGRWWGGTQAAPAGVAEETAGLLGNGTAAGEAAAGPSGTSGVDTHGDLELGTVRPVSLTSSRDSGSIGAQLKAAAEGKELPPRGTGTQAAGSDWRGWGENVGQRRGRKGDGSDSSEGFKTTRPIAGSDDAALGEFTVENDGSGGGGTPGSAGRRLTTGTRPSKEGGGSGSGRAMFNGTGVEKGAGRHPVGR